MRAQTLFSNYRDGDKDRIPSPYCSPRHNPIHTEFVINMASQSFSGKTVMITGSGGGLGKEIAIAFLSAGANLVLCDIDQDRMLATYRELEEIYPDQIFNASWTDITDEDSVEKLFLETPQLDILINNAGISDKFDPVGDLDKKLWDKVLAVNLTGPFLTSKLAVQQMEGRGGGVIINIGSIAGSAGYRAGAAYTASKHGLLGLTKNIAAFYGKKGIRCNALMPGGMRTNIGEAFANGINVEGQAIVRKTMANDVPLCDPKKIAATVLFLCSDAASDLNGACVPVDNGWTAT